MLARKELESSFEYSGVKIFSEKALAGPNDEVGEIE
jgi:hypothetical protein